VEDGGSKFLRNVIVIELLRAIIVESQQMVVARQRPINNNNAAVFSVGLMPFLCGLHRQCHVTIGEPLEAVFSIVSMPGPQNQAH
jgi:hypothetical protein